MSAPRPMLDFHPTQRLRPGVSLLEASAGTGKTYNITNLVIRLIAERGLTLPEILVVTFTRAATAELRERVRRRIGQAVDVLERACAGEQDGQGESDDPVLALLVREGRETGTLRERIRRLTAARESFDEATIATIHGFCNRTLLHAAFESDIDFDTELVQDPQALLEELVDDFMANTLRYAPPAWYVYVTRHCKVDRADLLRLAKLLEQDPALRILPERPFDNPPGRAAAALADFRSQWESSSEEAVSLLTEAAKRHCFRTGSKATYGPRKPKSRAVELRDWLQRHPDALCPTERGHELIDFFSAGRIAEEQTQPAIVQSIPLFDAAQRALDEGAEAYKLAFVAYAREELASRKKSKNVMSHSDVLRLLARGLEREQTREALRSAIRTRFKAALIDEFQDTDPVQWSIFRAAFDDQDHVVLIGDPKQAIYGFRGADVFTYLEAKEHARAGQYTMRVNWRSDRPFVRALNHLLAPADVFAQPGICYVDVDTPPEHAEQRLRFPSGPSAALRLSLIPRALAAGPNDDGISTEPINKGWGDRKLPLHVAEDVVKLLGAGACVRVRASVERPLLPGDIAVLVRKNDQARKTQRALLQVGVPAVINGAGSVFQAREAESVQRLLDALIKPSQETTARTLAIGTLFGMSANALATMEEAGWDDWLAKLHVWSDLWRTHGFMSAMRRVLYDEGVPQRLLAEPGGERAMTNVLHLAELLHTASWKERLGPAALAGWLRSKRLSDDTESEEEQLRLESDGDAVQIVTIHRSKGLEYPVVFAPYLWDAGPGGMEERHVRFHDARAGQVQTLDLSLATGLEPKRTSMLLAERERQTEALRLAYVALTRACHLGVVYWGAFKEAEVSPLASILHGPRGDSACPDRLHAARERFPGLGDDAILAELQALAAGSEGTIEVDVMAPRQGCVWSRPEGDRAQAHTLQFERARIDRTWGRGSFTRMVGGAITSLEGDPAAQGVDHHVEEPVEAPLAPPAAPVIAPDAPEVPLAKFPVGAEAGTFLHAVLEHWDFTRAQEPSVLTELVRKQMRVHAVDPTWEPTLVEAFPRIAQTPLGAGCGGLALGAIPPADRLNELRFDMPAAGGYEASSRDTVNAERLAQALQGDAPSTSRIGQVAKRVRALGFRLRGFLTGAIDLVFRARMGGTTRFFVADYKSNWLGERHPGTGERLRSTVDHYHPDDLARVMEDHHYVLQAHIYAVALHRYLRWRLGQAYDYEQHFGGVAYLFLRGMIGRGTPLDETGRPYGVHFELPPRARIEALSLLLNGPSNPRP